jgi:hypothetical protein
VLRWRRRARLDISDPDADGSRSWDRGPSSTLARALGLRRKTGDSRHSKPLRNDAPRLPPIPEVALSENPCSGMYPSPVLLDQSEFGQSGRCFSTRSITRRICQGDHLSCPRGVRTPRAVRAAASWLSVVAPA